MVVEACVDSSSGFVWPDDFIMGWTFELSFFDVSGT